MKFKPLKVFFILFSLMLSAHVQADTLLLAGAKWSSYSFEPLESEATPNYESFGLKLHAGYTNRGGIEFGMYAEYLPSKIGPAKWNAQEAQYLKGGIRLGVRLDKHLYLGVGTGKNIFRLYNRTNKNEVEEGSWSGTGISILMGGNFPISKDSSSRVSIGLETVSMTHDTFETIRTLNEISFEYSYLFHDFVTALSNNKIFKGFLNL